MSETKRRSAGPQVPVASAEMSSLFRLQVEEFQSGIRRLRGEAKSKDILRLPLWLLSWEPVIGLWKGYQVAIRFQWCFSPITSSFPTSLFPNHLRTSEINWDHPMISHHFLVNYIALFESHSESLALHGSSAEVQGAATVRDVRGLKLRNLGISHGIFPEIWGASPRTTQKLGFVFHDYHDLSWFKQYLSRI